jgi:hypothetical protein
MRHTVVGRDVDPVALEGVAAVELVVPAVAVGAGVEAGAEAVAADNEEDEAERRCLRGERGEGPLSLAAGTGVGEGELAEEAAEEEFDAGAAMLAEREDGLNGRHIASYTRTVQAHAGILQPLARSNKHRRCISRAPRPAACPNAKKHLGGLRRVYAKIDVFTMTWISFSFLSRPVELANVCM